MSLLGVLGKKAPPAAQPGLFAPVAAPAPQERPVTAAADVPPPPPRHDRDPIPTPARAPERFEAPPPPPKIERAARTAPAGVTVFSPPGVAEEIVRSLHTLAGTASTAGWQIDWNQEAMDAICGRNDIVAAWEACHAFAAAVCAGVPVPIKIPGGGR